VEVWLAAAIFIVAYALIALERFDRTLVALLGALLAIGLGVIDQHHAFEAIDLNVIFLLAGMMVIASIVARTGLFDWLALRSLRLARGRPLPLLLILCGVTAVLSAFLDNVTTVVLIVPVTLSVAYRLGVSPVPYLIAQILASNIGGTATLIGDPPNILIGSAAGLDFNAFLVNLGPVVIVVFAAFVGLMVLFFRSGMQVPNHAVESALEATESSAITNRPLLVKSIVVLALTLIGFVFHQALGLEAATIALLGATVLMLIAAIDPHDVLREVEWKTLFFFVGLFVLVEAIVAVGIVGGIADSLASVVRGDAGIASIGLLWFSALASAMIDNIPYTATAIPVVERLIETGLPADPLWWSLALGACLGGNLTIVGASANVVVVNTAARHGHEIGFVEFMRYGAVVTVVSLVIATVYVWAVYIT
jgi:Na+/H+ antiporter NhaD/arsenite permease-like protein